MVLKRMYFSQEHLKSQGNNRGFGRPNTYVFGIT